MPIPTPNEGEDQRGFMERCMAVMTEEMDTDQAIAVCMKQWRDSKQETSARRYTRFTAAMVELKAAPVELKAAADGKGGKGRRITGYATVFNRLSEDRGGYCYTVAPGAFTASVAKDDVRALFNHNPDYVLGRTTNGTLRLAEDAKGLKVEIDLPDTNFADDLHALIERGDVTQMSFGGIVEQETRHDDGELCIYAVQAFTLWDVSPVTFPAFEGTDIRVAGKDAAVEASGKPADGTLVAFWRAKAARAKVMELSSVGVKP